MTSGKIPNRDFQNVWGQGVTYSIRRPLRTAAVMCSHYPSTISSAAGEQGQCIIQVPAPKTDALTSSFQRELRPSWAKVPGSAGSVHSSRAPVYQGRPLCCALYAHFIRVTALKVLASFPTEQGNELRKAANLLKARTAPAGPGFSSRMPHSQACALLLTPHTVPRNQHLPESLFPERGHPLPNRSWAVDPYQLHLWTLGSLFQLPGKSISADTPALNSTSMICKQYKDITTKLSAVFLARAARPNSFV